MKTPWRDAARDADGNADGNSRGGADGNARDGAGGGVERPARKALAVDAIDAADAAAPWRPRLTFALVMLGLGLLFGLIEMAQSLLRAPLLGWKLSWRDAVLQSVVPWLLLAVLAPGVLALTERFRLDRRPRWSSALAHVGGAVAFTLLHQAGTWTLALLRSGFDMPFALVLRKLLILNFGLDLVAYGALVGGFHALLFYREFRDRELMASRMRAGLTQARLQALRAQLNPHFLFNTLNAISVLAMKGEQACVVQMLAQLSDLLRLSLDGQLPQEVPLSSEVEFIDRYLDLQRVRFSDRLAIEKRLDSDTLNAAVPSLILQPIVENAVLHGVAARRGPGRVSLRARRDGETLCLEVTDSGPGFPADGPLRDGVGLSNTRARLEQLYGASQTFLCGAGAQGGACVTIRIPFRSIAPPSRSSGTPTPSLSASGGAPT
jgi:signal transduction histidine kinase